MLEKINWLGKEQSVPPSPRRTGFQRCTLAFINSPSRQMENQNHPAMSSRGTRRALLISVNANPASHEEL